MEDVSNNTALNFDVVSIVLPLCFMCFCVGVWFRFEDFLWYAACLELDNYHMHKYEDIRLVINLIKCITINI